MDFLKKPTSEIKFGWLLLAVFLVAAAAVVIGQFVVVDNWITNNTNGSWNKKSLFMPLTAARKAEVGTAMDAKAAEKQLAEKK